GLRSAYSASPLHFLRKLEGIIGTLEAPKIVYGIETTGPDLTHLHAWQQRWTHARAFSRPCGPSWAAVMQEARGHVHAWANVVGRKAQLAALAEELLQRNTIDA